MRGKPHGLGAVVSLTGLVPPLGWHCRIWRCRGLVLPSAHAHSLSRRSAHSPGRRNEHGHSQRVCAWGYNARSGGASCKGSHVLIHNWHVSTPTDPVGPKLKQWAPRLTTPGNGLSHSGSSVVGVCRHCGVYGRRGLYRVCGFCARARLGEGALGLCWCSSIGALFGPPGICFDPSTLLMVRELVIGPGCR